MLVRRVDLILVRDGFGEVLEVWLRQTQRGEHLLGLLTNEHELRVRWRWELPAKTKKQKLELARKLDVKVNSTNSISN